MISRRLFLLAPFGIAFAQPADPLQAGFRDLYHLRFSDARARFVTWQQGHPSDPMGFVAEAASHLFEEFEADGVLTTEFFLDDDRLLGGITGQPHPARTEAFERASQRGRALAEPQANRDPRDANALLALALSSGMRADYLSLIEKKQVASLREIRSAESYGAKLLRAAPSLGDAYVAVGAANYILACLPGYKRAVLWFGGLQGDKAKGMDQLRQAARNGKYLAPYAKILLALASLREHEGAEAARLMKELVTEFPESPLFLREQRKIARLSGIGA